MSSKKFRRIFGVLLIFAVALVTGFAVGKLYVDSIPANVVMNMTEAELRDPEADIKKLVEKSKTKSPDSFSAVELYQIAEYNFNQKENYYKVSDGYAYNMVGKQKLYSYKLLRDGEFVFDNLSPGTVNIATRIRHTVGTDLVTRNTDGSYVSGTNNKKGSWNSKNDEKYSVSAYNKKFNTTSPMDGISYVISSKTCPADGASNVKKTADGNYTFTFKISGTYLTAAAIHYSYEIFYTSYGILTAEAKKNTILPAWKDSEVTVVVDKNFDFVSMTYDENYSVNTKFGYQNVNDKFTELFYFDFAKMPTLEEVL